MLKVNGNIDNLLPYQPGKRIEEIKELYKLANIIKLASNENSFGTSPKAVNAIKRFAHKANLYADGACYDLRKKIAEKTGTSVNNITVGNGSNEIIELLFRAFIDKGDDIISSTPTFSFYKICSQTTFGNFIEVPLEDYTFSLNSMLEKVNKKTKAVIICNPNNPTGTMVLEKDLQNFIEKIKNETLIIIDEAYIEFVSENKKFNSVKLLKTFSDKNIVLLRTFSKIYGLSSLRVGYSISNKNISDILNKVRQPFNVNGFAQVAALAALEDYEFYNKTLKGVEKGKEFLYKTFNNLDIFHLKSETNFILFRLKYDNDLIFKKFLERGIIIRSLKSFGYEKELRVTIGTMEENRLFVKALKEILGELHEI